MDCPVCWNITDFYITNCNHALCYNCYWHLKTKDCPLCREKIRELKFEDRDRNKKFILVYFKKGFETLSKYIYRSALKKFVFSKRYKDYLQCVLLVKNYKYYKLEENQFFYRNRLFSLEDEITEAEYKKTFHKNHFEFGDKCNGIIKRIVYFNGIGLNAEQLFIIKCLKKFGTINFQNFNFIMVSNEEILSFMIAKQLVQ